MDWADDWKDPNEWDSSLFDYNEFIEFFFSEGEAQESGNHVIPMFAEKPARIVEHIHHMCNDFKAIGQRYPLRSIDSGLWKILGPNPNLADLLFRQDVDVPQQLRIDTIKSMWHVYDDYVAANSLEIGQNTSFFYMWWDGICEGPWFSAGLITRESRKYDLLDKNRRELCDATVWTCRQLLNIDDQFVWICAFHGFGHSHHPHVPLMIDNFLKEKAREIPEQTVQWMRQCKEFEIM